MATLHVENVVRDFDTWKAVFDKFEAFRTERGVRSYRVSRSDADPHRVLVDLDFDSADEAAAFGVALEGVWRTPQSQEQLVTHSAPEVFTVVTDRVLSTAT